MIKKGTWVNIKKVILTPDRRPDTVPEDTRATPLVMWVSGFLQEDARLGTTARILTKMNRPEEGILEETEPCTTVTYGKYVPELLEIGIQARSILRGDTE